MPDREKIIKAWEHFDTIMEVATHLAYPDYSVVQEHCLALLYLLKEQPQIILCKDCINRHDSINCRMYSEGMDTPDDWFCADGKRRMVNKNEI